MIKTIEFVEKEIESTQNWLEYLDFIKNDVDIENEVGFENFTNFYNENKEKLKTLQQIKTDLEAWEVVKWSISKEHLEDCQIRTMYGENPFMNVSKEEATKVRKALEVDDVKN